MISQRRVYGYAAPGEEAEELAMGHERVRKYFASAHTDCRNWSNPLDRAKSSFSMVA